MSESRLPQRLIDSNKLSCSRLLQGTQSEDAQKPIRTIFFYSTLRVNVIEKPKLRRFLRLLTLKRIIIRTHQPCRK